MLLICATYKLNNMFDDLGVSKKAETFITFILYVYDGIDI